MIFTPTKCCLKHCEKWSLKDYSDYRFHLMLHYTRPGQAFLFIEGQGFPSISGCPGRLAPRPLLRPPAEALRPLQRGDVRGLLGRDPRRNIHKSPVCVCV